MKRASLLLSLVIWWGGCTPEEDEPPPDTSTTTTIPLSTTTIPPDPPPPVARPQDYIQWSCHASKPRCKSRHRWNTELDEAYTEWRGHRDLLSLLAAPEFLKGGARPFVDLTPGELELVIGRMEVVSARGDRLRWRIFSERHRDFDPDPLGDWHRSQVRKAVAGICAPGICGGMRGELDEQTAIYGEIAAAFPAVPGCDSLRCRIDRMQGQ